MKPLDTIKHMDAILAHDEQGRPIEPEWPAADVIVGNPPFLGDKRMRGEMGGEYVETLRKLYEGRVPGGADFVLYWFERTREMIRREEVKRAGLLATNSIRYGANRQVLERIKQTGDIFMAWSDRPWILDGAAVRVSMVGFDSGSEREKHLNGQLVASINPDLSSRIDITQAIRLTENADLAFLGMMKAGPFDIDQAIAQVMLSAPINPNGKSNREVVKPRAARFKIDRHLAPNID